MDEESIAGIVLQLLAEVRKGNGSSWAPYTQQLPALDAFVSHPLRSALEELQRFHALPFAQDIIKAIARGNETFHALANRSTTCLPNDVRVQSFSEYWWARLLVMTRSQGAVHICGEYVPRAMVPVIDCVNHADSSKANAMF